MHMFFAQGVYGCSVITGLTAQHPTKVTAVCGLPSQFVQKQFETLLNQLDIHAIKTGMIWSKENILAIAIEKTLLALHTVLSHPIALHKDIALAGIATYNISSTIAKTRTRDTTKGVSHMKTGEFHAK